MIMMIQVHPAPLNRYVLFFLFMFIHLFLLIFIYLYLYFSFLQPSSSNKPNVIRSHMTGRRPTESNNVPAKRIKKEDKSLDKLV